MLSNWHIESNSLNGTYRCYRCRNVFDVEGKADRHYDYEVFQSKDVAVLRCRELNAQLVDGWMADGHPQNW